MNNLVREYLNEEWNEEVYLDKHNQMKKEIESNNEIIESLLDEFEKVEPLDEVSWENIQTIKLALWIGYKLGNI